MNKKIYPGITMAALMFAAASCCPKPFDLDVPAPYVSAWTSNGRVSELTAEVSVVKVEDKHINDPCGAFFRVWADGKLVWASDEIRENDNPVDIDVDLEGTREIILETLSPGHWTDVLDSRVSWKNVTFSGKFGASIRPYKDKAAFAQLGILTPKAPAEPRINGADIFGVRPGHPVVFRVAATGDKPLSFSAEGLPEGVTFDSEKGILGGIAPEVPGNYDIDVTVSNASGSAHRSIRLSVGDTLALTPPMGWNSWNIWQNMLTVEHAKAAADAMESSGLAGYGWSYVNIDDYWERNNCGDDSVIEREKAYGEGNITGPARDGNGKIIPNKSFPDMKEMTDYIHSYGLKAGLYSSPGPLTCGKCEGSYGHELQDAESWAEWGFDYIKYDGCSLHKLLSAKHAGDPVKIDIDCAKAFKKMHESLGKVDRDIILSINPGRAARKNASTWVEDAGANCWRSWNDLRDSWTWLLQAIESEIDGEYWKYSHKGCWADPDMLVIGDQRSFGTTHPTVLNHNEQYTHISIWAMVSSPMLIGCDMTKLDDFTLSLLSNPEIIAISQDRLGKAARRYVRNDTENVWARPLANGDWAVALENLYPLSRNIAFDLSTIGLDGSYKLLDCWSCSDAGTVSGSLKANVPSHATMVYRLSKID